MTVQAELTINWCDITLKRRENKNRICPFCPFERMNIHNVQRHNYYFFLKLNLGLAILPMQLETMENTLRILKCYRTITLLTNIGQCNWGCHTEAHDLHIIQINYMITSPLKTTFMQSIEKKKAVICWIIY